MRHVLLILALSSAAIVVACLSSADCVDDEDCLGGDVCSAGRCVQCEDDGDCDENETCANNACSAATQTDPPDAGAPNVPPDTGEDRCNVDADCNSGEFCGASGECAAGVACCIGEDGYECAAEIAPSGEAAGLEECTRIDEECRRQCSGADGVIDQACFDECENNLLGDGILNRCTATGPCTQT